MIATGGIQETWWSSNSEKLYFSILFEGNFEYDLPNETTSTVMVEEVTAQTPRPELAQSLPSVYPYPFPFVAPIGNHALFVTPINLPSTPTVSPNIESGEMLYPSNDLNLWLFENGEQKLIGNLHVCSIATMPHWSPDERKVVIEENGFQPSLCFDSYLLAQAYLVDFDTQTRTILFPAVASEGPLVQIYGFSPDSRFLLHGSYTDATGANLSLLDLETNTSNSILAPVESFEDWISNQEILVLYRDESLSFSPPFPLGILNLNTLSIESLTEIFPKKYIGHVALSPNREWLAFATGDGPFSLDTLWLLPIDRW